MQEDPLHLIPAKFRPQLEEGYGLKIEGEMCPRCRYVLRYEYDGKVSQMPVRRVAINEWEGISIGTFVAAESGSQQSVSSLVGSVDESLMTGDRLQVAGRAYRLDGELNVANRGLMEFVEIFKTDERLLTLLLSLSQEQIIKMGKFGSVYADEVIIAHSNEGDFNAFVADGRTEALKDRIITVKIPYNLGMSEEVSIYHKMMREVGFKGVHMSPLTVPMMAIFAVISRLEPPTTGGMSLVDKLRLYDGQFVPPYSMEDAEEMRDSNDREGMQGISPRYVMNRLATAVTDKGVDCLLPLTALTSLWDGLSEHIPLAQEQRTKYLDLIQESVTEYDIMARTAVRRAAVEGFDQRSAELFNMYWAACRAYVDETEMQDPDTGVMTAPDERSMRSVEETIDVTERDKGKFRREIYDRFKYLEERSRSFDYATDPRIRSAVEKTLLPEIKELRERLVPKKGREPEAVRTKAAITQRLTREHGFCEICAEDIVKYVLHSAAGGKALKQTRRSGRIRWLWPPQ